MSISWVTYGSLAVIAGTGVAYLLFRRPQTSPATQPAPHTIVSANDADAIVGDKFRILAADTLIYELGLAPSIANIRSNLGLSDENWQRDALPLIHNFIEFVQRLPASESHHHAGDGGLVKHTLDVAGLALLASAAKSWPPNARAEDIARLTAVWRYGILTAALLHDIGKVLTAYAIELFESPYAKDFIVWMPDAGIMNESGRLYYRVTFPTDKTPYEVHASLGWTFFQYIVPSGARRWMSDSDPRLIQMLRAYLSGHADDNPLSDIIRKADMTSTARDLKAGSRQRFSTAKRLPLIEIVMDTLVEMLAERGAHFSIAVTAGGDIFRKGDVVFAMAKNIPDFIRDFLRQHKPEWAKSFPPDNQRIFDTLLEYGAVLPSPYDEHKAVTVVSVVFERDDKTVKSHQFTMLQFKLSALYPDGNSPPEFQGILEPLAAAPVRAAEIEKNTEAATQVDVPEVIPEQIEAAKEIVKPSFMATETDLQPKTEAEIIQVAEIPPPPKARTTPNQVKSSGIDALLTNSGLLDQSEASDLAEATTEAVEIVSNEPPPKPIGKSVPKASKENKPSKSISLLKDLFGAPATEQPNTTEPAPVLLPKSDSAEAAVQEIKHERESLPSSSPRPVTIKPDVQLEDIAANAVLMSDDESTDKPSEPRTEAKKSAPITAGKQDLRSEGKRFWNWLAGGLADGSISVNLSNSLVHFVEEGMIMVTPAIFREFASGRFDKNNPECPGLLAQKGFVSLALHQRSKRSAIYSALGNKADKKLLFHCYLVPEKHLHLMIRADSRPPNNIEITLADSQSLLQPHRSKK